ncbi:MAG TPA: hypothetical protein PKM41_06940 [Deltaproteobacteria bacterium]|jgi:hypothetical protein|nr:hypothetical protein [Deltaproteobacteria bacterium]HOI06844.1 hypothetical protein [Deltaproteobacteria bacterium]
MQKDTRGLCSNCRFMPGCNIRKPSLEEIFFCEEYRFAEAVRKSGNTAPGGKKAKPRPRTLPSGSASLGLCVNCAHRKGCTFPRPESGVWHCREYE